jgi:hypothetical protein
MMAVYGPACSRLGYALNPTRGATASCPQHEGRSAAVWPVPWGGLLPWLGAVLAWGQLLGTGTGEPACTLGLGHGRCAARAAFRASAGCAASAPGMARIGRVQAEAQQRRMRQHCGGGVGHPRRQPAAARLRAAYTIDGECTGRQALAAQAMEMAEGGRVGLNGDSRSACQAPSPSSQAGGDEAGRRPAALGNQSSPSSRRRRASSRSERRELAFAARVHIAQEARAQAAARFGIEVAVAVQGQFVAAGQGRFSRPASMAASVRGGSGNAAPPARSAECRPPRGSPAPGAGSPSRWPGRRRGSIRTASAPRWLRHFSR